MAGFLRYLVKSDKLEVFTNGLSGQTSIPDRICCVRHRTDLIGWLRQTSSTISFTKSFEEYVASPDYPDYILQEINMTYERNIHGLDKIMPESKSNGAGPRLMGATWPIGMDVYNPKGEILGTIKEVMLDMEHASVAYAVLSTGGVLGIGEKLHAVPWRALTLKLETLDRRFILDVDKERLESAPGFDKDNWPDMVDESWISQTNTYYGTRHYGADRNDQAG